MFQDDLVCQAIPLAHVPQFLQDKTLVLKIPR